MAILFPTGKEELLEERMKSPIQKGQPFADKIIIILLIAGFVGVIAFIPLDVFRFHLFPKPGVVVSSLGLVFFIAGWCIISLSYKENTFAIAVVRYQKERGQTVIDTGVYGIVRHPMYAGAVLLLVGMPLWLESCAGALLTAIPIGIIVVRILVEERLLRRELKGYKEYTHRVRHRLIPFLW
jgi:protein-S-isoprenylcysteine O-methyltransferase Ste14